MQAGNSAHRHGCRVLLGLLATLYLTSAGAQQATETVEKDGAIRTTYQHWSHVGLLRARDLTPFGLLRLDVHERRIW